MLLAGKTAIISGAASARGIGFATAKRFAEHGARVAILDLDEAGAQRAAKNSAGNISASPATSLTSRAVSVRRAKPLRLSVKSIS